MLTLVTHLRPYAELLYFMAGVIVAGGLLFTHWQLRMIKRDMQVRSERAAKDKAIEACERYYDRYVPKANDFFLQRESKKLGTYGGPIGDFSRDSISQEHMEAAVSRFRLFTWIPGTQY